jgi:hypothetical protein
MLGRIGEFEHLEVLTLLRRLTHARQKLTAYILKSQ